MSKSCGVYLSKTKFFGILEIYKNCKDRDNVDVFEDKLKMLLNYDPSKSTYNPEYGKRLMEKRKTIATEECKTVFELYKKPYLKENTKSIPQTNDNNQLSTG